ncbi:MAG TPA: plastocyanin/azurin family copper-binding protein [Gemmatimonadaceae bacterium]|nr:plastocyanin/azurin family copper-binding protein [Gemmatimonadaceae bacterium]
MAPAENPTENVPPAAPPSAPPPSNSTSATASTAGARFTPATITIAPGGSVTWQIVEATHNVTFGSAKPQGGDVPDTAPGTSVTRVFPALGTYSYQCTRHSGMVGQVLVQNGTATPVPPPPPPSPSGITITVTATAFLPEEIEITPGTTVTWQFNATNNVTFDDLRPPGGDIPDTANGTRVSRTFPELGDYDYRSSHNREMKGRIRVRRD